MEQLKEYVLHEKNMIETRFNMHAKIKSTMFSSRLITTIIDLSKKGNNNK